jgi:hypothetical protein
MEVTGTITKIYKTQTGTSKSGTTWQKREFVLKTDDQYPKTICFSVFSHVDILDNLSEGQAIKVNFSIESREFNGKWYHNINAFGVYPEKQVEEVKYEKPTFEQTREPEPIEEDSDLPF